MKCTWEWNIIIGASSIFYNISFPLLFLGLYWIGKDTEGGKREWGQGYDNDNRIRIDNITLREIENIQLIQYFYYNLFP